MNSGLSHAKRAEIKDIFTPIIENLRKWVSCVEEAVLRNAWKKAFDLLSANWNEERHHPIREPV